MWTEDRGRGDKILRVLQGLLESRYPRPGCANFETQSLELVGHDAAQQVLRETALSARVAHDVHDEAICVLLHVIDFRLEFVRCKGIEGRDSNIAYGQALRLVRAGVVGVEPVAAHSQDETAGQSKNGLEFAETQNKLGIGEAQISQAP